MKNQSIFKDDGQLTQAINQTTLGTQANNNRTNGDDATTDDNPNGVNYINIE